MSKKKKILPIIGTLAVITVVYFLYQYIRYVKTDNAQIDGHAVMLSSKVSGFVKDVKITEGQSVSKDDVLVEIDSRDFENMLKQVSSELSSIDARRRDAETNYKRLSSLYDKGAVSQQQRDTSLSTYSEVKAKYEAILAQVSQARLNLENTKIKAPSNGFIARKSVEVGQLASPGIPLIGFVSSEDRWVTANFKETELSAIKIGAKAEVEVDAISGHTYNGKVISIGAATGATFALLPPDNATGNFTKVVQRVPVKIQIENLTPQDIENLRVGLSAIVKVSK
jgi:membrane fusion protein (multidrug efflux system)